MSFNLTKIFHSFDVAAEDAADILAKIQVLIHIAEDSAKTGPEKLAAVKDALKIYVTAQYPKYAAEFDTAWNEVASVISALVSLYNALGLFSKIAAAL